MGGDRAPAEVVRGALAALAPNREILLVGFPDQIERELHACGTAPSVALRVVPSAQVVAMDDPPSVAVRRKRDSSMAVALDMVKRGAADGAVSMGNSGAMMALAMLTLGRIQGIERPAIATVFPTLSGGRTVLLDAGANVDCDPENLLQFALMGREFARTVLNRPDPSVGILSIGEEAGKGNALAKEACALISALNVPFVGNIEGRQLYSDAADVVVCDGFTGNVTLKVAEGTADFVQDLVRKELTYGPWRALLGLLMRPVFSSVHRKTNYDQYGGAPLLGVSGVCVIGHGRSNARAVANAISEAHTAIKNGLVQRIATVVKPPAPVEA